VIECEPAASAEVEYVATPFAPTLPVPICVVPSRNVTEPVIAVSAALFFPAIAEAVTVAVKVMFVPDVALVDDAVRAVMVEMVVAAFTTTVTGDEVLPL
jgi:hypothetical protein